MATSTTSLRKLLPKLSRLIVMPSETSQMGEETTSVNTDNKMQQDSAGEEEEVHTVLETLQKPAVEKKEKVRRANVSLPAFKIPATPLLKPQRRPPNHAVAPLPLLPPGGYPCGVCGLRFYTFPQLVRHKQFHDEDRPFPCGVCGKRFLSRSHYSEHQRVHTGERPFPCDMCERSFTTHHNLKRHMIIHNKEEMYRCRTCSVLFCQRHEYPPGMAHYEPELETEDGEPVDPTNDQSYIWNQLPENPYPNDTEMADKTESSDCTAYPTPNFIPETVVVTLPNPDITSKPQGCTSPVKYKDITSKLKEHRSQYSGSRSKITAHQTLTFPDLTSTLLQVTRNLTNYDKKKKKKNKYGNIEYEMSHVTTSFSSLQEERGRGRPKAPKLQSVAYDIEVVL